MSAAAWGTRHVCTLADTLRSEFGVGADAAGEDAAFRHMQGESARLCADPSGYARRLRSVATSRLTAPRFVGALDTAFDELRAALVAAKQPPHAIAEALSIVVSDIAMIEEIAGYGAPESVLDPLCTELADAALFVAGRLVLNLGRRLRADADHRKAQLDPAKIGPLQDVCERHPATRQGARLPDPDAPVLVVATAGRGTRLRSTIPKALIPLAGRPLVDPILESARSAGIRHAVVVLKHRAAMHPPVLGSGLTYLIQDAAEGTGHSFGVALEALSEHAGPCVLSYSDTPFLTAGSFRRVVEPIAAGRASMTILSVPSANAPDFGRLDERDGRVRAIVQPRFGEAGGDHADAGLYGGRVADVLPALMATENRNHRYEYSFTEVVRELFERGCRVESVPVEDPLESFGINRPADLVEARRLAGAPEERR